jgi:1,4-dihydroxy-2-naphthoate octaprenyltransferase
VSVATVKRWILATRPQFFTVIVLPILLGAAIAWREHRMFDAGLLLLSLIAGVLCHAGVNVLNDYFDWQSGADNRNPRPLSPYAGGSRMIQRDLLTPAQTRAYGMALLAAAVMLGLGLVAIIGLPLLWIGLVGVLGGWCYSAPPLALNYRGWGEVVVGLDFGVLAVQGAHVVQTGMWSAPALLIALPPSFLVAAILYVNQFPDFAWDVKAGKRTLVVALGIEQAIACYLLFPAAAGLAIAAAALWRLLPAMALIALAGLLPAVHAALKLPAAVHTGDAALIPVIRSTIAAHALVSVLLVAACLV